MEDVVYARQSVEKKNSISIEGQIDLCERTAGKSLKVYQDRGYSGKNTERPAFLQLMKDVEAGKVRKLYVYRLDRFSRSVADFGNLWEILQKHHVEFVSASENFDTSSPMGRAMLHIIMVFAQLERETTAERVKDNYYRRAALGSWPGGPSPYGYSIGRCAASDGRMVPTLIPNEQANIVQKIFELYAQEESSLGSVAKELNALGLPSAKRATWDNVALSRVLHSPIYVMADEDVYLHYKSLGANITSPPEDFDGVHGLLLVGKRDRSQKKYTDIKDHSISVLNSPGIISAELWLRCQNKLQQNRQLGNSGKGTYTWLTGLIKCAKCGYSIKVMPEGLYRRLLCSGRYNLSQCDATIRIKIEELEQIISTKIDAMLEECSEESIPLPDDNSYKSYKEALDRIDRRADRLMDAFAESSDMPTSYLQRALAKLEQERQAILEAKQRQKRCPSLPGKLAFSALSFDEKKVVAAQFIRRINIHEDHAEICWNV